MKLTIRHHLHDPSASLNALLQSELEHLQSRLQIDEARIHIEQRLESSPPFHVSVHLVTPGPDLFAESIDHTLRAAVRKTFALLEEKLGHRTRKRLQRPDSPGRRPVFQS